jgi:hypothetical protein
VFWLVFEKAERYDIIIYTILSYSDSETRQTGFSHQIPGEASTLTRMFFLLSAHRDRPGAQIDKLCGGA